MMAIHIEKLEGKIEPRRRVLAPRLIFACLSVRSGVSCTFGKWKIKQDS